MENIDCDMFLIFVDKLYFKNDIKMLFHFSYNKYLFYYYVLMEKAEKDMEQELIIRGKYY